MTGERRAVQHAGTHRRAPDLPFNTLLRVTNLANERSIVVRVQRSRSVSQGRILDLSYAAARALGANRSGVIRVKIRIVGTLAPRPPSPVARKNDPGRDRGEGVEGSEGPAGRLR